MCRGVREVEAATEDVAELIMEGNADMTQTRYEEPGTIKSLLSRLVHGFISDTGASCELGEGLEESLDALHSEDTDDGVLIKRIQTIAFTPLRNDN